MGLGEEGVGDVTCLRMGVSNFGSAQKAGCGSSVSHSCRNQTFKLYTTVTGFAFEIRYVRLRADLTIRVGVYFPEGASDDGILPAVDRALSICVRETPAQTASKNHE